MRNVEAFLHEFTMTTNTNCGFQVFSMAYKRIKISGFFRAFSILNKGNFMELLT